MRRLRWRRRPRRARTAPILKLKLGGDALDLARVEAVRQAAPRRVCSSTLTNHGRPRIIATLFPRWPNCGVELIEQPFPPTRDEVLEELWIILFQSARMKVATPQSDLTRLTNRYEVINVKLDKTGGLTEALLLAKCARQNGSSY